MAAGILGFIMMTWSSDRPYSWDTCGKGGVQRENLQPE